MMHPTDRDSGSVRPNGIVELPDGSGFFVATIDPTAVKSDPVHWNPYCKVVLDHRTGGIDRERTDAERALRGLAVPWIPEMADIEVHQAPVP